MTLRRTQSRVVKDKKNTFQRNYTENSNDTNVIQYLIRVVMVKLWLGADAANRWPKKIAENGCNVSEEDFCRYNYFNTIHYSLLVVFIYILHYSKIQCIIKSFRNDANKKFPSFAMIWKGDKPCGEVLLHHVKSFFKVHKHGSFLAFKTLFSLL